MIDTLGFNTTTLRDLKERIGCGCEESEPGKEPGTGPIVGVGIASVGVTSGLLNAKILPRTDIGQFLFRPSDPVKVAIEICTQAKGLKIVSDQLSRRRQEPLVIETLDLFSGDTCDQFLPDIFAPICSCVGTWGNPIFRHINAYPLCRPVETELFLMDKDKEETQ